MNFLLSRKGVVDAPFFISIYSKQKTINNWFKKVLGMKWVSHFLNKLTFTNMLLKKTKIFILLNLLSYVATAQDESVFHRINGVNVSANIFLKWDDAKKKFLYANDKIDNWYDVDENLIFKIRNQHKNNFKVFIEFYNPLKYSIKSEAKDIDDPAYQAINDFFAKLPTLPNLQSAEENKTAPALTFQKFDGSVSSVQLGQSILLHEWFYQFSQAIDTSVMRASQTNTSEFESLLTLINKIKDADDYLFDKLFIANIPDYASSKFTLNDWIKKRSDILYETDNDFEVFKKELATSVDVKKGLKESKKKAEESLANLIKLLSSQFDDKIAKFILKSKREDFKKYSNSTSVWLSMNHIDKFDVNSKAIDVFENYLTKLDEHTKKFRKKVCDQNSACSYFSEDHNYKLAWESKKMKSIKYEVKKLEKNGTEVAKSSSSGEFIVGKRLFFYPFISTGALYTNFSYPNYTVSVENGVNVVGKAPDTRVFVRPSVFLNFLITSWDPIYPFIQLGVTTGVNDAIFPVGAGLTIGKSFSISGGPTLGYYKDLNTLEVGKRIKDETELMTDLKYKGGVSWYFSINYNFGKK